MADGPDFTATFKVHLNPDGTMAPGFATPEVHVVDHRDPVAFMLAMRRPGDHEPTPAQEQLRTLLGLTTEVEDARIESLRQRSSIDLPKVGGGRPTFIFIDELSDIHFTPERVAAILATPKFEQRSTKHHRADFLDLLTGYSRRRHRLFPRDWDDPSTKLEKRFRRWRRSQRNAS